jgi:hypothetical protein
MKKIISFFKSLINPKKQFQYVSKKEVKQMYKGLSKNPLITIKLAQENELLKRKPKKK